MRICLYFQGQLRATGGSVTQKCPLDRAPLKAPITAEEFQIPRISHSLAQGNEVFSAPTRLQRFLFSPRLQQQQLSFKAQTPALLPDPFQPTEAKQTHSDVRTARAGPTLCSAACGQGRQGGDAACNRWGAGRLEMGSPRLPHTCGHHRPGRCSCSLPGSQGQSCARCQAPQN